MRNEEYINAGWLRRAGWKGPTCARLVIANTNMWPMFGEQ